MQNWNLLFRRTHLYLGLLLLPWMLIYALSTVLFNHRDSFQHGPPAAPQWVPLWEKDYALDLPAGNDGLRETARRIMTDNGVPGSFAVQRQGTRLNINVQNFWHTTRLNFDIEKKKLRAEQKKSSGSEVLIRLHERTGYGQGGFLNNIWALMVDIFCVTTLVWIATGLYLWWKLPATRGWGWLAIGGGIATILILLGTL